MPRGREPAGNAGAEFRAEHDSRFVNPAYALCGLSGDGPACGTLDSGEPCVHCALHVPHEYEPRYAYPLIVWFHDYGADERQILKIVPLVSGRNYAGLAVRGPLPVRGGLPSQRRWSLGDVHLNLLEDALEVSLHETCRRLTIHRGRIVAAGMGQGATVALRMMLRRPDWFAAAVCLDADWPVGTRLTGWGQYTHKPLWLGMIEGWSPERASAAIYQARLLQAAGFDVTTRVFDYADARPARLAREVDRWLMQALCPATVVT